MATQGDRKTQKRLSAPRIRRLRPKQHAWTLRARPGPYAKDKGVPLAFALRDLVGLARTLREVRIALAAGRVRVNGVARKDARFPVGLFDVVEIEGAPAAYRFTLDTRGRLYAVEEEPSTPLAKTCKVVGAYVRRGGVRMLATSDGRNLPTPKRGVAVGDSVNISLPGQDILAHLPLEKGSTVFITQGRHVGITARVLEVRAGTATAPALVRLEKDGAAFTTTRENVFVTGAGGKKA